MKKSSFLSLCVGAIGFLLSPLSWWNDLFVNIPLAWTFAWLLLQPMRFFAPIPSFLFLSLMGFGYFLTNVLGFWLMKYGTSRLVKLPSISQKQTLIATALFTGIVFALSWNIPAFNTILLPHWVQR